MTKPDALQALLAKVFDNSRDYLRRDLKIIGREAEYEKLKAEFVFHMTDWLNDLRKFHAMTEAPEVWETEEATIALMGMLSHVIPHLNAAGRLLLDRVPDHFAGSDSAKLLAEVESVPSTPKRRPKNRNQPAGETRKPVERPLKPKRRRLELG